MSRLLLLIVCTASISCVASDDADPLPDDPAQPGDPTPAPDPGDPESPADIAERLITTWQDCMQLEDFQSARMAPVWSQMVAQNNQKCVSCHQDGAGGFIATANEQVFFDSLKTNRYYLLQYVTADVVANTMIVNRRSFRDVSSGLAPHAEHPRFDSESNGGMVALAQWYDLAQARIAAECAPVPQ